MCVKHGTIQRFPPDDGREPWPSEIPVSLVSLEDIVGLLYDVFHIVTLEKMLSVPSGQVVLS